MIQEVIPMAENKQYITQAQEDGCVLISESVIIDIAALSVAEVEGVAGVSTKPGSDIVEMIGVKNWGRGLKVTIREDEKLVVDCNINVKYGYSVADVAKAVQEAVMSAVESMTNVRPAAVNVNVCGIVRQ